jgi:uncharacterized protein YndB with AHSA1/START domain
MSADQARVTMRVSAAPERAFEAFTQEINSWWGRGPRFRNLPGDQGIVHIEPGVGGRLFESIRADTGERVFEIGRITLWDPPHALSFGWRSANYAQDEATQVDILFAASGNGTLVTVTHRGWSALPPDHPVRHDAADREFLRTIGLWWADTLRSLDRQLRSPN